MASPSPFFLLLFFLLFSTSTANLCSSSSSNPADLSIFHTQSPCPPFSPPSSIHPPSVFSSVLASATKLDPSRLSSLLSSPTIPKPKPKSSTIVPISSGSQLMNTNNYVLRANLGTPPQLFYLALDTSADYAWVPCAGCTNCPSSSSSSSSSSVFNTSASSTYQAVDCASSWCPQFQGLACTSEVATPCGFNMSYGGDSISATVSQDALTMGADVVGGYAFGCVNSVIETGNSLPKQGLLGLGRGANGLLAQSGSLYQGVFSYCLPSFKSYYFSGSLRLGPIGQPKTIRTTPLLLNPHRPSLYYVNLTSVSVGRVTVPVPPGSFDFNPQTGAGTIVDSGTVITRFVAPVYAAIRDEFRKQVNATTYSSLGAFDTCFASNGDGPATPTVTLHLTGMDLALPVENTLIHSSSTPLACLALAAAPDNVNNVVNVIASYQQQNRRVLIDVANSKVGFATEVCS